MKWVAWQLYRRPLGSSAYNNAMDAFRSQTPASEMDSRLQSICNLAKGRGVIIYGIALDAPPVGRTQIAACATSAGHFYDVTNPDSLAGAFRSIANNISQLRLNQ